VNLTHNTVETARDQKENTGDDVEDVPEWTAICNNCGYRIRTEVGDDVVCITCATPGQRGL
jgi:hypothetical protein